MEKTMKLICTCLKLIAGAVAVAAVAVGSFAAAQTSTTTATSTTVKKPPTTATPQMIAEAIQRSKARTEKATTLGKPERWGSEEPFTFDPNR
jgi:hypothetical protein